MNPVDAYEMLRANKKEIMAAVRRCPATMRIVAEVIPEGLVITQVFRGSLTAGEHAGKGYTLSFQGNPFFSYDTLEDRLSERLNEWCSREHDALLFAQAEADLQALYD